MSEIAKEYGRALFELAREDGIEDEISEEVACIADLFKKEPAYLKLLKTPGIPVSEKTEAVKTAFRGCREVLLNTLCLLISRGYAREIPETLGVYLSLRREARGEVEALVETAQPLTQEEKKALTAALSKKSGKTVLLTERVNPALLGGARVYLEGRLLDGTMRRRLDGIGECLRSTVL